MVAEEMPLAYLTLQLFLRSSMVKYQIYAHVVLNHTMRALQPQPLPTAIKSRVKHFEKQYGK